jgi:hypothetical protein
MVSAMTMFPFSAEEVKNHFISAEQIMRTCDQVWSADTRAEVDTEDRQPEAGSCVYCKLDHLVGLFNQLRKVRNQVVLVSSESDRPLTKEFLERCPRQITHWFTTNVQVKDQRVTALPLGLANSYCKITLKAPLIGTHSRPFAERSRWLYVNFRTSSNPAVREPAMDHFRTLKDADWLTVREEPLSLERFLEEMTSHRFVLCPPGNGIDTHRFWEALYSRTIPVALVHASLDAFRDLPVLFVRDFRELTRDFLANEYERIISSKWKWQKLFLPWWRERIHKQREQLRSSGTTLSHVEFLREAAGACVADLKRRALHRL